MLRTINRVANSLFLPLPRERTLDLGDGQNAETDRRPGRDRWREAEKRTSRPSRKATEKDLARSLSVMTGRVAPRDVAASRSTRVPMAIPIKALPTAHTAATTV